MALGVAFAYLLAFLRMGSPEERTHLIEYGIVAALIHQALLERVRRISWTCLFFVPFVLFVVQTAFASER